MEQGQSLCPAHPPGSSSQGIMKTTTRRTIKPAQTRPPGVRALSTETSAARMRQNREVSEPPRQGRPLASGSAKATTWAVTDKASASATQTKAGRRAVPLAPRQASRQGKAALARLISTKAGARPGSIPIARADRASEQADHVHAESPSRHCRHRPIA